jgi:hypothetical protein
MIKRILIVCLALAVLPVLPSGASDPTSGTVSPTVSKLAYDGAEIGVDRPTDLIAPTDCVEGLTCDTFELTVDVPDGFYANSHRELTATITWTDPNADLNLFLCPGSATDDPNCIMAYPVIGGVPSSTSDAGTIETLSVMDPEAGVYRLIARSHSAPTSYKGVVTFPAPAFVAGLPKGIAAKPNVSSTSAGFSWDSHPVNDNSAFAEPSIDVDHSNVIYVSAIGGGGTELWRSTDVGKTFSAKSITSPLGGGDSEIEILSNDVVLTADLELVDSAVSRSEDRFNTYTQQTVGSEQDRQWLAHRCSNIVLLGYHDIVLEAEMVNRSTDGGVTWDAVPIFISPKGSAPGSQDVPLYADQGVNTFSGPMVVDQKTGDTYIIFAISNVVGNVTTGIPPFGDPTQIVVGVSHDEALTWELKLIESGPVGSLAGLIFPWITLDRAGNVYASWAGRDAETDPINVFMSYSNDHGETWSAPYRVNKDADGPAHIYTTMSAGDPGVVDIAWYTSTKPDPADTDADWYVDFAQVRNANTSNPQVSQSRVTPNRIHHGDICLNGLLCELGGDRSLLDFFQIQVGPDGMANIAFANNGYPVDDTPDDNQDNLSVWYARQTGGRSAGSALHDSAYCPKAAGGPGPLKRPVIPDLPPPLKPTKVLGGNLAGTGVGGIPVAAWVLLGTAVALGARFRVWRRRA